MWNALLHRPGPAGGVTVGRTRAASREFREVRATEPTEPGSGWDTVQETDTCMSTDGRPSRARSLVNEKLLRAVYISTARHDLRDEELATLLEVSRRNNAARGVTGALAYHDRAFIQVLEGPEAAVEALLARIARDPRHTGMSVFDRSRTGQRVFGGWSMGWLRASDLARAGLDPNVLFLRDTPDAVVNALLEAFRLTMRVA